MYIVVVQLYNPITKLFNGYISKIISITATFDEALQLAEPHAKECPKDNETYRVNILFHDNKEIKTNFLNSYDNGFLPSQEV